MSLDFFIEHEQFIYFVCVSMFLIISMIFDYDDIKSPQVIIMCIVYFIGIITVLINGLVNGF